jgi:hypothetical protein
MREIFAPNGAPLGEKRLVTAREAAARRDAPTPPLPYYECHVLWRGDYLPPPPPPPR